ncbi:MAG: VCBS repeat-containing protein [Clostridiales bacterium]|nr:VCBS repeat-containing protein [Clostridiales bacterium]
MKKTISLVVLAAMLCFLLSGCVFSFANIDEVLRPPRPYGTNRSLQEAFEKRGNGDVIFKSPVSGKYLSAFVINDIDGDGKNEAMVFFSKGAYETSVNMDFFEQDKDGWKYLMSLTGAGRNVYSVDFTDMNGDGKKEIAVCWSLLEGKSNKVISIYTLDSGSGRIKELAAELYTVSLFADIDGDREIEIVLALFENTSEKQASTVKVLKMDDKGAVKMADKKELDGNISGYAAIKTDITDGSSNVNIYIDAYKGESQMITDVVYWNKVTGSLSVPLLNGDTRSNTSSFREAGLLSEDINGDGIIDIPAQSMTSAGAVMNGTQKEASPFYITEWFDVVNGRKATEEYSLINRSEKCRFILPERNAKRLFVINNTDTNKWDFYELDKNGSMDSGCIFSVVFSNSELMKTSSGLYEGYSVLKKHEDKILLVSGALTDTFVGMSGEKLAECFCYYD